MDREFDKEKKFKIYLNNLLDHQIRTFIDDLMDHFVVYLFSGVIRNYFLNTYDRPNDLDLVLKMPNDVNFLEGILKNYGDYRRNTFGGYKIFIDNLPIDIWFIEDTWAIANNHIAIRHNIEDSLLHSTFFNFSSIIYDLGNDEFIGDKLFHDFLESREMDIVLENNPNKILCILKIKHYSEKYRISLSSTVINYYIRNFYSYTKEEYIKAQKKHFGNVIYEYQQLLKFYNTLKFLVDYQY
ncbi:hypothetical protein [Chryseobacterium indologenes]|uniref:hypothetical protein n=1 Tax=Chryseobacterium indologenes TaxID=253 RepID=UPI00191712F5|nr:hypothetical protein [Chryseobacterium indologenes]QQQ70355.1 hypothetical protein JHW31_17910 [Chryseobacterium indologenes]